MKKDKKVFILIEVVLAMLVLIVLLFMFQERADQGVKKIAVIVPNSDHSRWASFKYGLQMAETDFDVETVVVSTGETLTAEEEAELMESEIDNGADGILAYIIENGLLISNSLFLLRRSSEMPYIPDILPELSCQLQGDHRHGTPTLSPQTSQILSASRRC